MINKIKINRQINELTQEDLARKVGVSRQTIYFIEQGKYVPSTALSLKLAIVLGKSVESLFQLESEDWDGIEK